MEKALFLLVILALLSCRNQAQVVWDYDGNAYDTVMIGTQVWLKENLRVTHYNNGDLIPNITGNTEWAATATGARCYYNNDSASYDPVYGVLYNWYAVSDSRHLCPAGWHVSGNAEWQAAENYLGGDVIAGGKMKEEGTLHWLSPNTGATNASRFTGLPGGCAILSIRYFPRFLRTDSGGHQPPPVNMPGVHICGIFLQGSITTRRRRNTASA